MKQVVSTFAEATESVSVESRQDLDTSYIRVGDQTALYIKGSLEERVAFLHNLISAAETELASLLMDVAV